jgi:phage terminase large subunit-like protein
MRLLRTVDLARIREVRRQIEASLCADSLSFFFERAWPVVEPTRALLPSVAIDGFCAAGQAVADGRIRRLGVETCPGTSKSLFWAVIFTAWLLLRSRGRARAMAGSYAWSFAERDAMRCRDLVQSEWYRGLVAALGDDWAIREDANKKGDWWTTATGRRLITSVDGATVGQRCTWQIIDDPLSEADVFSAANKAEANRWVFEVMTSRLEDQRVDPRLLVMQRLTADDPMAEARKRGWQILSLPAALGMWGVPEEGCVLFDDNGVEVWRDTRKPGEPILELLDLPTLERLRLELGTSAFAAKYLQRPGDDSAALFRRTYWNWYAPPGVPLTAPRPAGCDTTRSAVAMPVMFDRIVITVDLTFGSTDGDYASVAAWGSSGGGRYLIRQWRDRAGFEVSKAEIVAVAGMFPGVSLCIEKAANGHAVIEDLRKVLPTVKALRPWGKKLQRHAAAVPTAEAGNCYLPLGVGRFLEGNVPTDATGFVEEHAGATKYDDQIDTTSYAIIELNGAPVVQPQGGAGGGVSTVVPKADAGSIWSVLGGSGS